MNQRFMTLTIVLSLLFILTSIVFVQGTYNLEVHAFDSSKEVSANVTIIDKDFHKMGDINWDGVIDQIDLELFNESYPGEYNPEADLDEDGDVDYNDLFILSSNYGKTSPSYTTPFNLAISLGNCILNAVYANEVQTKTLNITSELTKVNFTFTTNLSCTDTDSSYYTKGQCTDSSGTYTDYCEGSTVKEYYCSGTWDGSKWINRYCALGGYVCPDGCKDGACFKETDPYASPDWHYVIVYKDQEPGWYCINITNQTRLKFEFRKVRPDYARCLWAVIDYNGPRITSDNCAPGSWGCYKSYGTLTPYQCWNFAGCTADGGKLYRLCSDSSGSFVIDLDDNAEVACAYATVWPEDCPGKNCWQAKISETNEPPTPLPENITCNSINEQCTYNKECCSNTCVEKPPSSIGICTETYTGETCTDTDGGRDFYRKGHVFGLTNVGMNWSKTIYIDIDDICVKDSVSASDELENALFEYSCSGGHYYSETYFCPNGCEDGACVNVTIPVTEEYMTVDLWEVFYINETAIDPYRWQLFDINKDYYSNETLNIHSFVNCKEIPGGRLCNYDYMFQAIKEGKAIILLQKMSGVDDVVEKKYFYITIKETFTKAYLNKPFELSMIAPNSQFRKAKIVDYKDTIIELLSIGQDKASIFVSIPGTSPTKLELYKGESKDIFGVNVKLLNTVFDWEGKYESKATFLVTLQTTDFSFNIYSGKYFYLPRETVDIKAILSGTSNFDFQNAKVEINLKDSNGNIINLPVKKLGTVTTECVESATTKSYICPVTNHYSFYSKYTIPSNATLGLYSINAKAVLGNIEKNAYSSFKVVDESYSNLVYVTIEPKEIKTMIGKPVKYDVTIFDKHPVSVCIAETAKGTNATIVPTPCEPEIYNYLISVDDLPYHTVFPTVVSVHAGGSKTFELKIFPSPIKTVQGIGTAVKKTIPVEISPVEERAVGITASAIAQPVAITITEQIEPTYIREAIFRFTVKASLRNDPTVSDTDTGVVYVKYVQELEPPTFPDVEKFNIELHEGWNLISLPGKGTGFTTGTCSAQQKPIAFIYLDNQKRYVSFEEALEIMGPERLLEYASTHSFWIYSSEDCNIGFKVTSYSTYSNLQLVKDWNLLGTTKDMIGETLNNIKGDCNFEKIYAWNADSQEWIEKSENDLIEKMGYGIAVKTVSACTLKENNIQPPPFPED